MQFFKNILIPVDLTVNTETAVKKGLELADRNTCIHLLYINEVNKSISLSTILKLIVKKEHRLPGSDIRRKLNQWEEMITGYKDVKNVVIKIIRSGSVQQTIIEQARKISADLIIIAKNSSHSLLPQLNTVIPGRISKETASVVLTVKPGGINNKVKTMLVPVTDESAFNKAALIYLICRRFPVKIHLLAIGNYDMNNPAFSTSVLLQLYQKLKAGLHCQIEFAVLKNNNKPRAILKYAEKINADILLLHTEQETKVGWPNRYISDLLPATSKIQVWAV